MHDKRNPNLVRGDNETSESFGGRLTEHISKLEWQSEGHRQWYTHKNPYGCWICELLQIARLMADEMLDGGESTGQRRDIVSDELEEDSDDEFYNIDDEQ